MPASGSDGVTNVVVAGLGGQGIVRASDILADAAFRAGLDVKKSELHGMSQRGGSVTSDVRFGARVLSPMVPAGEADFLLVIAEDQVEANTWQLRPGGLLIEPSQVDRKALPDKRVLNVALLGVLSAFLDLPEGRWLEALRANLAPQLLAANRAAFALGRAAGISARERVP
jgi:indolepyruvate ferredoxin oxidoreductase beta subunit